MEHDVLHPQSAATDAFREAVEHYASRQDTDRVQTPRSTPRVKVLRVIRQLSEIEPGLPIERVYVDAFSGCSDFRGTVRVEAGNEIREYDFAWDCRWRAEQQGWQDLFGFPDQIRAAREFGWDCFEEWQLVSEPAQRRDSILR